MIWCDEAKILATYVPHDDLIWLVTSTFALVQVVRNEFRIGRIFYEAVTNEIIVVGSHKVTRYPLHNKEQTINPWKTVCYVDSEYGPLWEIECSSLVPQSTSTLRLVGSYMDTIYVLPLESGKDREDGVPAAFLAKRLNATKAAITVLHFHLTSMWIITGDQQGNAFTVMGWDLELNNTMTCFGGHAGKVRDVVPHPSICGFITCSDDNVLQVWSCNLRDKTEGFASVGEIWAMATNLTTAALATLGQKLSCFNMLQLYIFYAPLT
ncbi:uncharacterized protein LOC111674411 [Orussus abietinus]|uniref:uncharacterized protein LOC111674411 n=1 Tax=Orussus abietinus TaxID=222816 RepID=UPI000C716356|nr:uncharacterized protein LOC111674411 [Orussus abietinus]